MGRILRVGLVAGSLLLVALWTVGMLGVWWVLQAGASALDGHPPAVALQALTSWTEHPWVRVWIDPQQTEAVRDGITWVMGLGGGPAAWLGTAMTSLGVVLVVVWAGGLVLGLVALLVIWLVTRRALSWLGSGTRATSAPQQGAPLAGDVRDAA